MVGTALSEITGVLTQHILQVDLHGGSASGDRGRLRDWWIDNEMGIIYFRAKIFSIFSTNDFSSIIAYEYFGP